MFCLGFQFTMVMCRLEKVPDRIGEFVFWFKSELKLNLSHPVQA